MTRIMAALWVLCLKRCPHIKTTSSLNKIVSMSFLNKTKPNKQFCIINDQNNNKLGHNQNKSTLWLNPKYI